MLPLVCIDVDGTLVGSSGRPTPAVWAAAEAAVARGQRLAICTARGAFGPTYGYATRLDPDGWHVFHAGASLVRPRTGDVRAEPLPDTVVAAAVAAAAESGWVIEQYAPADYVVDDDDPLAVEHAELLGVSHRRRHPSDLDGPVVRIQLVVRRDEADAAAAAAPPGAVATVATSPAMVGVAFVSFTRAGVDKTTGIAAVAREMGVTLADVMMVGDGPNDLEAVATVGHGVAMGNAHEAVLEAARHRVAAVDRDGLVEALALSAELPSDLGGWC